MIYNRQLLLSAAKRNEILELWEVQRYGTDSYGDSDYISIYGMRPAEWYARGVRLLGRTVVECTGDWLAHAIGKDTASVVAPAWRAAQILIIDPFAGSGNTLYWLLGQLPYAKGLGFEADPGVFRLTRHNLASLKLPIDILNSDYRVGLSQISPSVDQLLIAFLAPPWGDALDRYSGLDLRRTTPPVTETVDFLLDWFPQNPILCVIQVYETLEPTSLTELKSRFDWSKLRVYELNPAGQNHGILLGVKRWDRSFVQGTLESVGGPEQQS